MKKQTLNSQQPSQHRRYALALLLVGALLFIGCGKTTQPAETEPPKPPYTKETVIRIEAEGYTYLARVTADTLPDAKEVPVHIFTPYIQRKIGDTLAIQNVQGTRAEPPTGWGTRAIAAEYFDGTKWEFEWNIQEMADHYLLPETFQGVRRLEFSNIRFPIPVAR